MTVRIYILVAKLEENSPVAKDRVQ